MHLDLDRARRTRLASSGFIYLGGQELSITVKNISINGLLAHLNSDDINIDYIFNQLHVSTIIDLFLPKMRLVGEVEVVRADIEKEGHILLALEFKNMAFDIDENLNKRKVYRKNMIDLGRILLNDHDYEFTTVNVSVEGLMVFLSEAVTVQTGTITSFQFERLALEGQAKVMWVGTIYDGRTLIGLEYVNLKKNTLKERLPRFAA